MHSYTFATTEGNELTAGLQLPDVDAATERAQRWANDLGVVVEYWDDRAPSDAYEVEPE